MAKNFEGYFALLGRQARREVHDQLHVQFSVIAAGAPHWHALVFEDLPAEGLRNSLTLHSDLVSIQMHDLSGEAK